MGSLNNIKNIHEILEDLSVASAKIILRITQNS